MADEMTFSLDGADEFEAALDKWVGEMFLATAAGTKTAAKGVVDMARTQINSRSGRLARSIKSEVKPDGLDGYTAQIGPQGVEYARKVELGKKNPHGALGYPYLQPGYEMAMATMTETYAAVWRAASPKG